MEDDGERTQLLQSILDLLLARGYFRARISSLSAFDKLTGGLAWCITFSKVDVDFDIFYDDDATLYYKIFRKVGSRAILFHKLRKCEFYTLDWSSVHGFLLKGYCQNQQLNVVLAECKNPDFERKVGEAIEEALQRMACPHPLQAHQIQGLDYQAVLPVVQWLVKRVLATLEEFGDQARRYAHLQYQKNYNLPYESLIQDARLEKIEAILEASLQEPVRELLDGLKDDSLSASSEYLVPADALHYESSLTDGSTASFSPLQSTRAEVMEDSFPGSDISGKDTALHYQQVQNLEQDILAKSAQIAHLQTEVDAATQSITELQQTVIQQDERNALAQAAMDELQITAEVAGAEPVVQKLMDLLEKSKTLEKEEANFRAECRRKRSEMQAHIKQQKDPSAVAAEDDEHTAEVDNAYNVDLQKWSTLRSELSRRNRAVALLQRRLDDMPSQTELMQYERRFVELYLHIQRKLRETRKYYATYNALAEAQELTVKELSLLNSIHSQFELAMTTPGGRSKFVESLEGIAKGVQQKLHQIERRFEAEQSTYSQLKEKHAAAVTAQRQYYAVVKLFQEECARSEKLQSKLAHGSQTENK